MGGSIYPFFRFLRKVGARVEHWRNAPRLRANLRYLEECKQAGRSPYDGLAEHLNLLEKKPRGKE